MIECIPTRSFLLKQEELEGGRKKDVYVTRGQKVKLTEREAITFWGGLNIKEADRKKLLQIARTQGIKRKI